MKTTVNLGLKKPEGTDVVNIDDLNYNADVIDTELQKRALKIDIPTIPVQSVNGKTGEVTLTATDVGAATSAQGIKADTALQSSQLGQTGGPAKQDDFVSHLADNTKHVAKDGTLQTGLNAEKINGKTATATPVTNEKTDLIGMVNEAFTNANNGKTSVANAIGAPSTATETFSQLAGDINTQKNNLATNLTNKGQSSSGTDTLANLVAKVANINTGKRAASGTVTSSISTSVFQYAGAAGTSAWSTVTVTGLAFKPSLIVVKYFINGNRTYVTTYDEVSGDIYPKTIKVASWYLDSTNTSASLTHLKGDTNAASVTNGGFVLPVLTQNVQYTWYAVE